MTHEPSVTEPEGGIDGTAWLSDAAAVEPELLPGVPVGDLAPTPARQEGVMVHVLDLLRLWVAREPARLADRLGAFLMAATAGTLYSLDEQAAAAVAGGAVALFLAAAKYIRGRVVPTHAKLPPQVIERLEADWQRKQQR